VNGALPRCGRALSARARRELKDPRRPDTQRYLRKLYADPVTGKNE
jgi:hypothetical protein